MLWFQMKNHFTLLNTDTYIFQNMTLLEDESMTVEECGVEENQSILIEGKLDTQHI